ncbi:MAG: hypothetical protein MUF05_01445 [Candidatus Omnitrophica bacterium]|jgi:hypothetical protein|nr:hypothetical protein [Candidatus Omnitrophota bacterium]
MSVCLCSRKSFIFSLAGHIFVFAAFSFSFGRIPVDLRGFNVSSFGGILNRYDLAAEVKRPYLDVKKAFLKSHYFVPAPRMENAENFLNNYHLKPAVKQGLIFSSNKSFAGLSGSASCPYKRKIQTSTVILYPQLPHYFGIYFRNQQKAHIELEYMVTPRQMAGFITVRRKISSGDLEMDLLCARYISQYLSTQQDKISSGVWHKVKIELGAK